MNKDREIIITWLKDKIDKNIVFDSVPENDNGWYEIKRESVVKILDGLIPMIKGEVKKLNIPDVIKSACKKPCTDVITMCNECRQKLKDDFRSQVVL
jgi:hypothetical protein